LRPLIWLVLGVAFYWAVRELFRGKVPGRPGPKLDSEEMVRDPECGVYLPVGSALKKRVRGEIVYFCSRECEEKYTRKPDA
jgi:YHS domain-containing protein